MKNKIKNVINRLFHDGAIAELRLLNNGMVNCDLTYNDILYLSIIDAHSGEYTASNIADMLYVSRPAVTQKINDLEEKGYIYKVQSETDKRVYKLHIDKNGASREYYKITDKTNNDIIEKISKDFTEEQITLFCEMTEKVCKIMLEESNGGESEYFSSKI